MSKYELFIECRFCREGRHDECSSKPKMGAYDSRPFSDNDIVNIRCLCKQCQTFKRVVEGSERSAIRK
jgi:hypothetical protein